MSYIENSPEAKLGDLGEEIVDYWSEKQGGCRLEISRLGKAALFKGPDGRIIAFDRLAAFPGLGTFFYDVKTKLGPVHYQKLNVLRQGIDLPHWHAYVEASKRFRIAGALAIVQLKPHRNAERFEPRLLWASIEDLQKRKGQIVMNAFGPGRHGIFWDLADFDDRGPLQINPHLIPVTNKKLHPWELRDRYGHLRMPPLRPPQLSFDFKGGDA